MKHLKRFNEGFFSSEYDDHVKRLFDKIKSTFDINNLGRVEKTAAALARENTIDRLYENSDTITYKLEETDSETGYITLQVLSKMGHYDTLLIDDEEIPCSFLLRKKICTFFESKLKEKIKNKKLDVLKRF